MPTENERPSAPQSKVEQKHELARQEAVTAAGEAAKAKEIESAAQAGLDRARERASDASEALKKAIEAEAKARAGVSQAESNSRLAAKDAQKALETKAGADKAMQRANERLRSVESRQEKEQSKGKEPDLTAVEDARRQARDAESRGRAALRESAEGKERLEAARADLKNAQDALANAVSEVAKAREDEASARRDVTQAEGRAKTAAKEARRAEEAETKAARNLDAAAAKFEREAAGAERTSEAVDAGASPKGHPETATRAAEPAPESKKETLSPSVTAPPAQPSDELYSGPVTIFVARPADAARLKAFHDALTGEGWLSVKSIGGSALEGIRIVVAIDPPVPLLQRLNELRTVGGVAKKGKAVEVTLKQS